MAFIYSFFGVADSNNDLNVLDQSPIFDKLLYGYAPAVNYTIDDRNYTMGYYLSDGIYFDWLTFIKTIS